MPLSYRESGIGAIGSINTGMDELLFNRDVAKFFIVHLEARLNAFIQNMLHPEYHMLRPFIRKFFIDTPVQRIRIVRQRLHLPVISGWERERSGRRNYFIGNASARTELSLHGIIEIIVPHAKCKIQLRQEAVLIAEICVPLAGFSKTDIIVYISIRHGNGNCIQWGTTGMREEITASISCIGCRSHPVIRSLHLSTNHQLVARMNLIEELIF